MMEGIHFMYQFFQKNIEITATSDLISEELNRQIKRHFGKSRADMSLEELHEILE